MTELEHLENSKADLEAKIVDEKHKAECADMAKSLYTAYSAFYTAGFTSEQAWYFTRELFHNTLTDIFNSL